MVQPRLQRPVRGSWACVATFVAALLACGPAGAQVMLLEKGAPAGAWRKLTFVVASGCTDSMTTTRLAVRIPAGITVVRPQDKPNWTILLSMEPRADARATRSSFAAGYPATATGTISRVHGGHDHQQPGDKTPPRITEVTWFGGLLGPKHFDEFALLAKMPDKPQRLYFDAVQSCGTTRIEWTGRPRNGAPASHPAPTVQVGPIETREPL